MMDMWRGACGRAKIAADHVSQSCSPKAAALAQAALEQFVALAPTTNTLAVSNRESAFNARIRNIRADDAAGLL